MPGRLFAILFICLSSSALAEVKKIPIFEIDNVTYALFEKASRTGDFDPFISKLRSDLKAIYDETRKDEAANDKQVEKGRDLGDSSMKFTDGMCAPGGDRNITGDAMEACGGATLGALIVNAIAQPIIFSKMLGHTVVFVANATPQPVKWKKEVYIPHGEMTHEPSSATIPPRSDDGVSVGMFVFKKKSGFVGDFGVIDFELKGVSNFLVGFAMPYHDTVAIQSKSKTVCRFSDAGSAGQQLIYDEILDTDKSQGILTSHVRHFKTFDSPLNQMVDLNCRLDSVDRWATTLLVDLNESTISNIRRVSLYTKKDGIACPLVPVGVDERSGILEVVYPAIFACGRNPKQLDTLLIQLGDKFWGQIGKQVCAFVASDKGNAVEPVPLLPGQTLAAFDCASEPSTMDVKSFGGALEFSTEINSQNCPLIKDDRQAVFSCESKNGVPIFAN